MDKSISKFVMVAGVCCLGALSLGEAILTMLSSPPTLTATTVPANGDVNPYGVAFVPQGFRGRGNLHSGDILVSNFNASSNFQGTGTTIMRITPHGGSSVFFQGPQGLGLTTALGVLKRGFVLVGNLPTTDGSSSTIGQTSLIALNAQGKVVNVFTDPSLLDGPWDLTVRQGDEDSDDAQVFVSNVLNGTVTRLDLEVGHESVHITHAVQIASGYAFRTDPAALVVGPTGLAYSAADDRLYVASTGDNAIYRIDHAGKRHSSAGTGAVVYSDNAHLRGPLGLVLVPNGHFIATNGDAVNGDPTQPSEMVEFTKSGQFVAQRPVNATAQGGAFGIALTGDDDHVRFAAVDDIANALDVWDVRLHDHDRH